MSETLFVSDIHLDAARPAIIELFNSFLAKRAARANALYILGDLFEYWIGDDAQYASYEQTFSALRKLTEQHIPVYFLHGNRDFLVAQGFAANTGITLLQEEHIIELFQQKILLMHGDTLCTDDIEYQNFRKKTHNKYLQWLVLHLPIKTREKLAKSLRNTSQRAIEEKPEEIMDVNATAVNTIMQRHGVQCLIHGHTHRPAIHEFNLNELKHTRAVLGDWYQQGNVLSITDQGMQLEYFTSIE